MALPAASDASTVSRLSTVVTLWRQAASSPWMLWMPAARLPAARRQFTWMWSYGACPSLVESLSGATVPAPTKGRGQ